ncbi:putative short chain dehydrogenase/reductase [Nocardioides phosphati]|jgi:NAD(P)-dependent dehydrogenase (short-subunit alcohol dehydrogenase family)|uniref:Short chain dehydrogenase/reductase n=1 Tax=Nocardioides phosphati TaxID=1867775 RepID=A0ABQ2NF94_9ACTN|nr:SDR family NAD(P)-dependent oxidoreductase [Nocardioides phosphati]GGO94353.1 putative short chain dehydrogenase/reductase [Nocardioides phosphati]
MIGIGKRRSRNARAVVTGAGSGIGQAFAVELAARGGQVVVSDIDLRAAQATVNVIQDEGGRAHALKCDVSRLEDVEWMATRANDWFEAVPTLVINNAGVGAGGPLIGDVSMDDWQWTLGINLWGPIHGCHVFAPILREAGYGGIINVSSAASFGAAPRMAAYNVSKAGVLSLSETLSAELSGTGVNVSVLCPTLVKTNIFETGRINRQSVAAGSALMRAIGMSPRKVARITLDAHDRGGLYVMPQLDAKVGWEIKRHAPRTYTRALGLLERFGPLKDDEAAVPTHAHTRG